MQKWYVIQYHTFEMFQTSHICQHPMQQINCKLEIYHNSPICKHAMQQTILYFGDVWN